MNHVILIGRLVESPKSEAYEENIDRMAVTLAVPRTFKNKDGIYETDFIRCILWNAIAKKTEEYCKKGDMVAIRGRLQVSKYVNEEGKEEYHEEVITESLSFVSSLHRKEEAYS